MFPLRAAGRDSRLPSTFSSRKKAGAPISAPANSICGNMRSGQHARAVAPARVPGTFPLNDQAIARTRAARRETLRDAVFLWITPFWADLAS